MLQHSAGWKTQLHAESETSYTAVNCRPHVDAQALHYLQQVLSARCLQRSAALR